MKEFIKDNLGTLFALSPLFPGIIVGGFAQILGLEITEGNKTQTVLFGKTIYGEDLYVVIIFTWFILFTLPFGIIWQYAINAKTKEKKKS